MFTGIVESIGTITATQPVGGDVRITVSAPDFTSRVIELGDSIAINGACLTVIERFEDRLSFDVSVESINLTLIGEWKVGTRVNLEMALLPTTRLGGHMVSGHVDGLASLVSLTEDARSWRMVFKAPKDLAKYIAKKGSITINGTSLTVNSVDGDNFDVNVSKAHIEVDLIARYLERLLKGSIENNPQT